MLCTASVLLNIHRYSLQCAWYGMSLVVCRLCFVARFKNSIAGLCSIASDISLNMEIVGGELCTLCSL